PLRTAAGQNNREHWRVYARRVKAEKAAVGWVLRGTPPAPPLLVTLTRIAPSNGLDDDNLTGSMKAIRDAVARWLGVDDKHASVRYRCTQERGPWSVRIAIEPTSSPSDTTES
ncbi:MAG: hypothetical protein JWP52_3875, partial [Rhizobacter sp.]|nr:hypothetical protein [Rhizobacter sp.]